MDKSYVTLEQKVCPVCGVTFDSGSLLLDKRLKATFEPYTVTGYDLCPEHRKVVEDGFLILVEADEGKSTLNQKGNMTPASAYRTGNLAYMKKEAASKVFNVDTTKYPFTYVEVGVIEKLKKLVEKEND